MKYLEKTFTVGPPKTTAMACERCVCGRGEHAEWCPIQKCPIGPQPGTWVDLLDGDFVKWSNLA